MKTRGRGDGWKILLKARETGESVNPGVERSETPDWSAGILPAMSAKREQLLTPGLLLRIRFGEAAPRLIAGKMPALQLSVFGNLCTSALFTD